MEFLGGFAFLNFFLFRYHAHYPALLIINVMCIITAVVNYNKQNQTTEETKCQKLEEQS